MALYFDYTTATIRDPNSRVAETSATRLDFTGVTRSEDAVDYWDKGAGYYAGDFEFYLDVHQTSGTNAASVVTAFSLQNITDNSYIAMTTSDQLAVNIHDGTTYKYLYLRESVAGSSVADISIALTVNTTYYLKIKRDEAVGTYGTFYCYIFASSANRAAHTSIVDTLVLTLRAKTDFRYLFGFSSSNAGNANAMTGYQENLADLTPIDYTLACDAGSYALTGQGLSPLYGRALSIEAGSYALTGQAASPLHGRVLDVGAGSYALAGQDVSPLYGRALSIEAGSYALIGTDATFPRTYIISPEGGVYNLAGQEVILLYSPTGVYTIICDAGSYALTGQDVGVLHDRAISIEAGSLVLTGQDVSLLKGYQVSGEAGAYTLTGTDAGLLKGFQLDANTGSYTLTGYDITLTIGGVPLAHLFSVGNLPQGATVEIEIEDHVLGILRAWSSTGVIEKAGPSRSNYRLNTSIITTSGGTKGIVYWRTSDLAYELSDDYDVATLATAAALATAQTSIDAIPTTPLLASAYTAPDNAGIARLLGLALENHVEDDIVRDGDGNKTGATIYLYDSAANAATHDKIGGTGLVAKYTLAGVYAAGKVTQFTVVKV